MPDVQCVRSPSLPQIELTATRQIALTTCSRARSTYLPPMRLPADVRARRAASDRVESSLLMERSPDSERPPTKRESTRDDWWKPEATRDDRWKRELLRDSPSKRDAAREGKTTSVADPMDMLKLLPQCVQTCMARGPPGECSLTDYGCLCSNEQYLGSVMVRSSGGRGP